MPGVEDRLRSELERLAHPSDPDGAFDRVASKRARRRVIRRLQVVALVVAVVAGTGAGTLVLAKVFSASSTRRPVSRVGNGALAFVVTLNVQELDGPAGGEIRNTDIFTVNPDGSAHRRLTTFAAMDGDPSFSPDGRLIAFTRGIEVTTRDGGLAVHQAIFVMKADGTGVQRLTGCPQLRCASLDRSPVWSPDGTWIAFASGQAIELMKPAGTGVYAVCRVCANGFVPDSLTWSPDGTRIAYSVVPPDGIGLPGPLYVVEVRSGRVHLLTDRCYPHCPLGQVTLDFDPAWAPDGTRIAFDRQIDGVHQIFVVNEDGSGLRELHATPMPAKDPRCRTAGDPVWSPDGRQIAFVAGLRTSNCAVTVIQLMDARGRILGTVPNTVGAESIAWQPLVPSRPHPSPKGSGSPSITSSAPPSRAKAVGQAPFIGYTCGESQVVGDFDGDGRVDTAAVHPTGATFHDQPMPCPSPLHGYAQREAFSLTVALGTGAGGTWDLSECVRACEAYAPVDIDGNGTDELAIVVDESASTKFLQFLELPPSEAGPILFEVAPPGTDAHPGDQPLVAGMGGPATHQDFVTCRTPASGSSQLITTSAVLSHDQATWNLVETVFDFDGSAAVSGGEPRTALAFTVVSTRDYTEPPDPNGAPPTVTGDACFVPG